MRRGVFMLWVALGLAISLTVVSCVPEGSLGSGRIIEVPAGGDFQAALNNAQPGDTIVLQAGATYTGNFRLPNKPGEDYIIIQTSALDALPADDDRIDPSYSSSLPKLVTPNSDAALAATGGAHHYVFWGIEFGVTAGIWSSDIVKMGLGNEPREADLPHDIVFDQVYIHGDPRVGSKRGLALNGRSIGIANSYISDIKTVGQDTQAICGWNGPGPFSIVNNYLEAAGENVMFGGAPPAIRDLVPSDIEIRHNHFDKPLSWRIGDPSYSGTPWAVKNIFELKNARRVVLDGNILEHSWVHGQTGFAVLLTVRTENGVAPWAVVEDITITRNIIRHAAGGFNISGVDDNGMGAGRNIVIKDNLLDDINDTWGTGARLFQVLQGPANVTIDHNTGFLDYVVLTFDGRQQGDQFVYRNNLTTHGLYGVHGSGRGVGRDSLDYYVPGYQFEANVLVGGTAGLYPPNNFFPRTLDDVGFTDYTAGDYHLTNASPYKGQATDGKDIGADIDAILEATAAVIEGSN